MVGFDMDKSYLWKRHNTFWVRVRVPDKVRHIIGKSELSKNLFTSDLSKANNIKHGVIAQFKQQIIIAEHKNDGLMEQLSKKDPESPTLNNIRSNVDSLFAGLKLEVT